jgi:predicted RND superfamily exporter protein
MAYYGNDPEYFKLIGRKDMRRLGTYVKNFQSDIETNKKANELYGEYLAGGQAALNQLLNDFDAIREGFEKSGLAEIRDSDKAKVENVLADLMQKHFPQVKGNFSLNEVIDTAHTTLRIRMQMKDIGSYEIAQKTDTLKILIDEILNPDRNRVESYYAAFIAGSEYYLDSIFNSSNSYRNSLSAIIAAGNEDLQYELDVDDALIFQYVDSADFKEHLRAAIDAEYLDFLFTGTSVIAAEGTQYLVKNLLTSLMIAIAIIAILMSFLFGSWRMVIISLIPNFIPLLTTAGIMGFFHIPVKPSTILVFSIAFGISVDDTIHFLAKYRQELKVRRWNLKQCVINALRETGLSMFYTSIVLFFGFSMFTLSQFGGTQALGLLVSLTLLVAMLTNLAVLPSLLLSLENRIANKAFEEPLISIYDEEIDIDLKELEVDPSTKIPSQDPTSQTD